MKDSRGKQRGQRSKLKRQSPVGSSKRRLVKAAVIFAGCILISVFVYSRFVDSQGMHSLMAFTAAATAFILNLFGGNVQLAGTSVSSANFSIGIVGECTGLIPTIIFVSAVLAYPCRIKDKVIGMAIGIFGLYLLNLTRTVSLFYIGSSFPSLFNTAHFLVWQSLIILAAIALWLFWVGKLVHAR